MCNSRSRSRKGAIALVWAAILVVCGATNTQAQFQFPVQPLGQIICVYSAVPNQVRSEDLAARTGDARLDCTNTGIYNPSPGAENNMVQYVTANFTVSLNTAISGFSDGTSTPSVLVINSNDSYFPVANSVLPASDTCGAIQAGGAYSIPDGRYPCPQKGTQSSPNSITWSSVQFPVPGAPNSLVTLPTAGGDGVPDCVDIFDQTSSESCFNVVTTVRMTNIFAQSAAVEAGGAIFANLTVSAASISVTPSNQQTLANVFQGLFADSDPVGQFQCIEGVRTLDIELDEGFSGAFKTSGPVTLIQGDYAGENGYPVLELSAGYPPQSVGGLGGGATQATRFRILLRDVPEGVVPSVPNTVDEDATGVEGCPVEPHWLERDICIQRVEGADVDGAGGAAGDGLGDYEIPLVGGEGQVIYEVMNGHPFRRQDLVVPVSFTCMAGSPTTSLLASANFAPISDEGESNAVGPVPRFIDTGDELPSYQADLRLRKNTSSYNVEPGVDSVVFQLEVRNLGPHDAANVELVDVLPAGLTHASNNMGCNVANNIVTCDLGTVVANAATVVTEITASVDPDAAGIMVNNASVMSDAPEPTPDPNLNMDTATVVTLPDLTITSLTAPNLGEIGGTINVSVDVANTGFLPTGPFQLAFYFSLFDWITPFDTPAALTCTFVAGLANGASTTCAGPIGVPATLSQRIYYFGAIVDFAHAVVEADENNNDRVADTGPINIQASSCSPHVVRANQTLSGTQVISATSTATLGPDLIIDGDDIAVNAPTVSILAGTSIGGVFSIGTSPMCP